MKKIVYFVLTVFLLSSCSDDEIIETKTKHLTIQIKSETTIDSYLDYVISLTELQTGNQFQKNANENGNAKFEIPSGKYSIQIEKLVNGVTTMYGREDNHTFTKDETLEINVTSILSFLDKTFVLDELYFNGADNDPDGWSGKTYYEQYFTIRNVSDRTLFIDGFSVGVTADLSIVEDGKKISKFLPDNVVLSQFYTIPGNGSQYPVKPNESIVIARSAINHNEDGTKPKSLDLSGAHFEIFVPSQYSVTVDNPDVTNLIVDYSAFEAFQWQYSGSSPLVLFKLDEDHQTFFENNKENLPNPASMGTMNQDYMKLPVKYIVDAVETGAIDNFLHKVLPISLDASSFLVEGSFGSGFTEQFVKRKVIDNKVQDTNNSENDFELIVGGQKSYPKK